MKKYLILIIALFITEIAFSQSILNLINRSNEFLDTLEKGKFEDAQNFFDEGVKDKVQPEILKNFWNSTNSTLGNLESVESAQNKTQEEFFVVTLICKFSKGTQGFQFVFNQKEKMVGFFVVPKSNAAVYQNPVYADSTLYKEQPVSIKTSGHELAGLLTTPKSGTNFPVIVLVHGSGPSDMDESIGPNKPFKDLALGLAAKGIATIRYVKRTRVYPGEFNKAFTLKEEVTDDALAAIALAKTITGVNKKQIYVLGHSLGGMLAPKLASLAPDVNGIIMAAAPARKFTDVISDQNKYMFESAKDTTAEGKKQLQNALTELEKTRITKPGTMKVDSLLLGLPVSYWIDMNLYDQVGTAKKLKKRILILQGENDFQVPVMDYNLWKGAFAKKKNVTFKLYPELNHLFITQPQKGSPQQYQQPGNVAGSVIDDIALWVKSN
ncbi:MAG TPA: alpha/beta fold hydrolase [Sphingobacteriaceae bacterium]|nr:alpha/beta fold hydrolase [Sphingobacteriaceae bacterium]